MYCLVKLCHCINVYCSIVESRLTDISKCVKITVTTFNCAACLLNFHGESAETDKSQGEFHHSIKAKSHQQSSSQMHQQSSSQMHQQSSSQMHQQSSSQMH
ncbi:hypothetical protein BsWGS_15544 [Bradybaena similaris]